MKGLTYKKLSTKTKIINNLSLAFKLMDLLVPNAKLVIVFYRLISLILMYLNNDQLSICRSFLFNYNSHKNFLTNN